MKAVGAMEDRSVKVNCHPCRKQKDEKGRESSVLATVQSTTVLFS